MPAPGTAIRPFRLYTDAERQASLQQATADWQPSQDIWVFGYGSLIWRPDFAYEERQHALVRGYHRSLCLWSRINRGTPEHPGLVFGLDAGGSCRGMAFRIPAHDVPATLDALWRREMPSGAYVPKWLGMHTPSGRIRALAFVMNRHTDAYVRDLPEERLLEIVRSAHGSYGPCSEYVLETARALRVSGIQDARLETIVQRLQADCLRTDTALAGTL